MPSASLSVVCDPFKVFFGPSTESDGLRLVPPDVFDTPSDSQFLQLNVLPSFEFKDNTIEF